MYKLKTKKAIKDRFNVSKNGVISRRKMGARHLRSNKSSSNKRRDKQKINVAGQWKKKITQLLGV